MVRYIKILLIKPPLNPNMVSTTRIEPLELEYLAAAAHEHEVDILDMRIDGNLTKKLKDFKPHLVGMTAYTCDVNTAKKILRDLIHRHKPEGIDSDMVEFVKGDLLNQDQIKDTVKGCQIVCHLAAAWDMFPPAVFEKENNQLFESIIRGSFNVLEAAYKLDDIEIFLYASTDAAYATGPRKFDAPITEDTELFPSRFYALGKIVCESMVGNYGKLYGLPWEIVRICWSLDEDELLRIYSYEFWEGDIDEEDKKRLSPKLSRGKGVFAPLQMTGESAVDHIADPDDIAEGIVLGIENREKAAGNIFNLAGPKPFEYLDVIEDLAQGMGVPWDSAKVKGIEPYELRNDRAKKYLGYDPKFTMKMMIEKAVKRYRKNGKKVNE